MFLNLKSKHITEGSIVHIEKKQGKLTCESNFLENPNIKKQKFSQSERIKYVFSTASSFRFVTI